MKSSSRWVRGTVLAAVCSAMVAAVVVVSPTQGQQSPSTQPGERGNRGARGPSLSGDMRAMGQAYGKIRTQYKDPAQNDSTLALLSTFESQAAAAKGVLPPSINGMPEADRKKATDEYRSEMRDLIRTALDLEDEINAGDMDKAAASVTKLGAIEKTGHSEFRKEGN
jgi:hypothetical protein